MAAFAAMTVSFASWVAHRRDAGPLPDHGEKGFVPRSGALIAFLSNFLVITSDN